MARSFRSEESYVAERTTRDMLVGFLEERGFTKVLDERKRFGRTESQILRAVDENGRSVALWVRLCWRISGKRKGKRAYSAAQLLARVKGDDWLGTIRKKLAHAGVGGVTHLLMVQRIKNAIRNAAEVPLAAIIPIWTAQRDISAKLIKQKKLGKRTKNHAMNGASPTLWLQDDAAPDVAQALWDYPGVRDLARLPLKTGTNAGDASDDSIDDLPMQDYDALGSDGADRVQKVTSGVKRDPKVRKAVLKRSKGRCEREGCGIRKLFSGFLDVHHILGAEKSDRVWNCVALCPNCHREAHASPKQDQINARLLTLAAKYMTRSAAH